MPIARFEQIVLGGARNLEGKSLTIINDVISSGQITPDTVSTTLFGPVATASTIVVSAIGTQLYAIAGLTPVADFARSKWIPSGGYAVFHVPAGHAIAVATANLS